MTSDEKDGGKSEALKNAPAAGKKAEQPEWANGLRQLYDSVVEEPLPDQFEDLLAKLDAGD